MSTTEKFEATISKLGFHLESEDLFLCNDIEFVESEIKFHLEIAKKFDATAVFFKKEIEFFKPQIYIYDYTGKGFEENVLTEIHKKVWTSGNVPLVCVFYDTEIKILNTTAPIKDKKPNYLEIINLTEKAKGLYDVKFAVKIKTGAFWEAEENKKKFEFAHSAYDTLINHIKKIIKNETAKVETKEKIDVLKKLIIKCLFIRFLEEKAPDLFREQYFNQRPFVDSIGNFEQLTNIFTDLERDFNGNIFSFSEEERTQIASLDLHSIALAFNGDVDEKGQRYIWDIYDFRYIPTELMSRLYEEFLAGKDNKKTQKEKKQKEGIFYTPVHLAKLLVDEAMPLKNYASVNLQNYKILDPACGSGIFLVLAFKRLIQWWRLQQYEQSRNFKTKPNARELKQLLRCVYGVDKEEQATKLTTFSLCIALCDELQPMQMVENLRFDDLTQSNILYSDFFVEELNTPKEENEKIEFEMQKHNFSKLNDIKFDLVIGNPPFDRGAIKNYSDIWKEEKVKIPQGQIALKFLSDSLPKLKDGGLQCLIIKSSGLLYNSTSDNFKKALFSKYNVKQIYDFTALARNNSLWENGAEVATAGIFIKNEKPDNQKNILHLTFRRTKATKDKIVFEIDKYDKHYINRIDAINNPFIWKVNLLGGGRLKLLIESYSNPKYKKLKEIIEQNSLIMQEGHGTLKAEVENYVKTNLRLISKNGVVNGKIENTETINFFEQKRIVDREIYYYPNIIVSETLDNDNGKLKIALNKDKNIIIKNRFIAIALKKENNNNTILDEIYSNLVQNNSFYYLYSLITSAQTLVNLNTSILAKDIYNLPYIEGGQLKSSFDKNVSEDAIKMEEFIRHGESKITKPIIKLDFKNILLNFGAEFSKVLNLVYENEGNRFRLSDVVILLDNTYIATIFKYDDLNELPNFDTKTIDELNIENLTLENMSSALSATRIITMYADDTIIFIKPNQYRYWLSSIAYRDADSCFVDLVKAGY